MSGTTNSEGTAKKDRERLTEAYDLMCEARNSLCSLEYVLYRMVAADEAEHDSEHRLDAVLEIARENSRRVESAVSLIGGMREW